MLGLACAAAAAGCGRLGFDALGRATDGAPAGSEAPALDADLACATFGPWSTPVREVVLSSTDTDWGPTLSRDRLEIVFASSRSSDFRLYAATRVAPDQPWSAPTLVAEIPGPAQDPSLSSDRLELYWGAAGGIGHATRATHTAPWTNLETVLSDTAGYGGAGGPDIARDGLSLVFTATQRTDTLWHEYITTRAAVTDAFTDGVLLAGVTSAAGDAFGSLRGDGLEVMYSNELPSGPTDLFAATRATTADAFGASTLVTAANSAGNDGDADLSDDGLTLTFASDRPGADGQDIFTSTRSCEP